MPADGDPPLTILIDDSIEHSMLMERFLRRAKLPGHLLSFASGEQSTEFIGTPGRQKPDLVLLDWKMPGMDGPAVLNWLRSQACLQALRVLILSGSTWPDDKRRALELGADGYIVKPGDPAGCGELARQIAGWYETRAEAEMLRSCCAAFQPDLSLMEQVEVRSAPMMTRATPASGVPVPHSPQSPLVQMQSLFQAFLGYVSGGHTLETTGLFADRKLVEITRACREEGIDERLALGRSQDIVLVRKRGKVIRRLMALEWSDTELLQHFQVGKRTIVEQRRVYREMQRKSCALVAPALG